MTCPITEAFNKIYSETQSCVLSFVTSKCKNTADISDVVQEVYFEVYLLLKKRGVDYVQNGKAIVLKIARQKLSRYYSVAEKLRMFVSANVVNDDGEAVDLSDLEADAFLSEDFLVDRIMIENARDYLKQKPEVVKKVFYLFYDIGLTIPEVAEALSISQSGVKNKLYRTLKELREFLQ